MKKTKKLRSRCVRLTILARVGYFVPTCANQLMYSVCSVTVISQFLWHSACTCVAVPTTRTKTTTAYDMLNNEQDVSEADAASDSSDLWLNANIEASKDYRLEPHAVAWQRNKLTYALA